jgi:hypothetical protein
MRSCLVQGHLDALRQNVGLEHGVSEEVVDPQLQPWQEADVSPLEHETVGQLRLLYKGHLDTTRNEPSVTRHALSQVIKGDQNVLSKSMVENQSCDD